MNKELINVTKEICIQKDTKFHIVKTFSIDTIFEQYTHIDKIINSGFNPIEMEIVTFFAPTALIEIPLCALYSVFDNII
ncbi:MAG: phosphorylase family protein [Clostridia bacterium]|nr:phosphorylase family protein [Clostridia bacterium]